MRNPGDIRADLDEFDAKYKGLPATKYEYFTLRFNADTEALLDDHERKEAKLDAFEGVLLAMLAAGATQIGLTQAQTLIRQVRDVTPAEDEKERTASARTDNETEE